MVSYEVEASRPERAEDCFVHGRTIHAEVSEVVIVEHQGREIETFQPSRFNVGQKVNAVLNAAFSLLFLASGLLLFFGERDTRFRFASTVVLHDGLMYAALGLLVGHLYLAVIHPATRHSLRGMTRGTVREDWARRHYPRWAPPAD